MGKILLGAIVGVFLGAFAVEILKKKSPATLKVIEDQATKLASSIAAAFHEGEEDTDGIIGGEKPA